MHPGSHNGQILRRRMQRFLPFSDRRTSKVWNHYTQLSLYRVECNHCKRQLSFHNTGSGASSSNAIVHQETDLGCLMYNFPAGEMSSTAGGSSIRSGTKACSNKRAEVLTDLILEMVFRDLQPLSVVEERGFKLLLSCLEPNYPVPSPSLLGSLLWHRYHILKQCLQQHLQTSLASHCLTLCTEYWRSIDGCGVDGDGQYYLTVSAHFVDSHWRLARCVLETRPIAEFKGNPSERGQASFADTLRAVLSEFQLPENFVFCVVHPPPGNLPEGWAPLQGLADARAIVLHFQHDVNASTALSQKAKAVNKESACLVLNNPGRWTTAIEMCESLLELKWVISSVLEEQKVATNLADHQWRLIHELVPVLKTVRIAASFLSEDINGPISALMPCLQGVSRLLGQKIAECTCPVVRGVMERIRAGMDKRWSLSDEDALLDCPAILSSFLDPRFKELRFLSPHARSKLHDKVKELLSVQAFTSNEGMNGERRQSMVMEEPVDERREPLTPRIRTSPLPQSMYDILLGEDPTERMPEIHQQLENYIAEPLCRRSLSPLQWWHNKEHRFPAVARLARKYLSIPATSVSANRAFAPRESPVTQRRATLGSKHLDHILFLHQNTDYSSELCVWGGGGLSL
uniref:Uncharacterized LOC107685711 n=1 Tax=Sinocyclocheilus anshuiensis TaxID=1608454 RepID=A0A671P3X8_9TELE